MRAKLCETQTSWYASVPFAKGFNTQINKGHCLCFESSLKVFSHSSLKQCCSYLKAVTLNSWVSGFPVETELMHLINNNVSPGTVASSLMKCIKEREHYCFQHSLHHHAKIFKWWKHWMIFFFFFAALLDSEEKYVIWLDVYRILMKCFVISCQSRKSLWNGRVLHHSYSLGVGCLRPWIVWHSKSNFMSNLRVIRELVWSSLHDEESRDELWESNSWGERYCLLLFAL